MILFNKGSFDIDSLVQKQKTKDNNRAGFIGESVLTLAFLSKVLCRGLKRQCGTTPQSKFVSFKIHVIISAPMLDN